MNRKRSAVFAGVFEPFRQVATRYEKTCWPPRSMEASWRGALVSISASAAGALLPGQPGAGGREVSPADGHRQGQHPAAQEHQVKERLLTGVVGQRSHGQLV
jgi:hypothetical protein